MSTSDPRAWMWNEAYALIERATRLHRHAFQPGFHSAPLPSWEPPIDVFENDAAVLIIAALPGVEAEDLKVELDGNEVIISGLRRLPVITRETAIHRLEIPCGRFERRIRLEMGRLELDRSELASGCLSLHLTKRL